MRKSGLFFFSISMTFLQLLATPLYASDKVEAGRVVSTQCAICHGQDGEGNGLPKSCLSCLDSETFEKHMHAFKSGSRRNYMMEKLAKNLSEKDIDNLAIYYATKAH